MEEYTTVFAWGGDHFGQLGLGGKSSGKTYASPRICSFNILIKSISCGEEHSGFISHTGHIYTMGSNTDGRLGIGTHTVKQSASPCLVEGLMNLNCIKISCGWGHTIVMTDQGEAYSWGVGEQGALGNGSSENLWMPNLVNIPRASAADIACGSRHTAIILQERTGKRYLAMCGGGEAGQLGTGKREKELTPIILDLCDDIAQVACGVFHSAFVTSKGNVYTMGGNSFGQLGLGTKKSQSRPEKVVHLENVIITKVQCSNFTAAISDKGHLYVWGSGVFGEFLLPHRWSIREPVNDISIGSGFGIAIDTSGSVYVWGGNSNGELGLDDYDPRLVPSLLPALKGKDITKIACGGNFCLGLGADVMVRSKTPGHKKMPSDSKNTSEEMSENWGKSQKNDEVAKLCFEVKQTYKSYEEIKRNFESLSERYEIEKRNNEKHIEELAREVVRYKVEVERCRGQLELDNREIREMAGCIEELKRINSEITSEAQVCKGEIAKQQRIVEDTKYSSRLEFQKSEEKKYQALQDLESQFMQEQSKRKQCEKELEKITTLVYSYEDTIQNYQHEINQIGKELQQSILKNDLEKKKLLTEIEKYQREISELGKRSEMGGIEKEKVQSLLKQELERNFKENKELKFQLEMSRDKIEAMAAENAEILNEFNQMSHEKEVIGEQLRNENERWNRENMEVKRKLQSIVQEVQGYESAKGEIERLRIENLELSKRIERVYMENEKFSKETFETKQKLDQAINELKRTDSVTYELERANKENLQLLKKIEYLTSDKEKIATSLSAEIEEISSQKADLLQKYDQLYIEKEKKFQILSAEVEKFSKANYDLHRKSDQMAIDSEKMRCEYSKLSKNFELQSSELLNFKDLQEDLSKDISHLKSQLSENERLLQRQKQEIESLLREKEGILREKSLIASEHTTTTSEIHHLHSQLSELENDISSLKSLTSQQSDELYKYQEHFKLLTSENISLKKSIDEKHHEMEKLHQKLIQEEYLCSAVQNSNADWEKKFGEIELEVRHYQGQIADLEGKNRQLLENLEKELSMRAKEYKERTMNILTTPLRSNSPHLRPPTPGDTVKNRHLSYNRTQNSTDIGKDTEEFQGNTAARLLQTLEDSPKGKLSRANARTPTKEDIKARIANLMHNRNRLESEISKLDE